MSSSDCRNIMTKLDAIEVAKILEASPNEVYLLDRDTFNLRYANPLALKNLGYSLEQLQTMTVLDIAPAYSAQTLNELVAPLVKKEVTQINTETIHRRADGSIYPIEVCLQLIEETEQAYFFAIIVDISKRKSAEESLETKTNELASVANNIPGVIYRIRYTQDGQFQVEYISDRVQDILELPPEDIYADFNCFLNLVHPDDLANVKAVMKERLTTLTPLFWEGRIITRSQRLVWVEARSEIQQERDGSLVICGVVLDITAQKKTELALQESEEKFRQFAENIDDIFWMIDPNLQKLFYVSPAYEKIWGYSAQAVVENPINFINHIHPEDQEKMKETISQPILDKQDSEYRIIRPNGEIRWLRDRAFPIKNKQGEVYRVAGIAQDITQEKQAQTEISRNRELREAIFNEASDALYLLDPSTLKILDCNRRAVELSAASSKEDLMNLRANCLNIKPLSQVKKNLEEQGIWYEEVILTPFRGEKFWGDVAWKQIHVGGETLYLVRLTDISDRKAFETELKTTNECLELTNKELERATRLKDEFLANMSHELRTPMNAILGMSEALLQEGSFEAISEQQKQAVKTIESSAKHLLCLINEILDLAKIQSGKITLNLEQTKIQDLCENSLNLFRQQAFQKRIYLHNYIKTSISNIKVDQLRIQQVLINLLSNAIKFTPSGGDVLLNVQEDTNQENIIFSVTDTGTGIPKHQISQLFEPFVQLNSQLNRQHGGTGLGLSLVRRLTELHGGTVAVESQLGKGSTFYVKLPYREVTTQINHGSPTENFTQSNGSSLILVANSDQPTLQTTCSYLEASGYEVIAVDKSENFLPTIIQLSPQIIIIDWSNFEGISETILDAIRETSQTKLIPILILFSKTTPTNLLEKFQSVQETSFLQKPVRLRQLINEIKRLLREEFPQ